MDCSLPDSSVHGVCRQEYWSGFPLPSSGHLLDPGIEPASLASPTSLGVFFTTVPPGSHVRLHSATSWPPPATPQQMNTAWHHRWVAFKFHLGQLRIRHLKTNPISHVTTDRNLISPYKTTFCGLFSRLTETLAGFTPCIVNRVISSFVVHSTSCTVEFTCFDCLQI